MYFSTYSKSLGLEYLNERILSMQYTRNASNVRKHLRIENNQLLCDQPTYVHIPTRFMDKGLGEVGTNNTIFGIFPVILANSKEYGIFSVDAMVYIEPFLTDEIDIDGVSYYSFYFEADTPIVSNLDVIKNDSIIYNILDEFLIKGKVPWYIGYEDLCKFLDTAESHAASNVGANYEIIEILSSMIARSSNNRKIYIRNDIDSKEAINSKIEYIPLSSVMYVATGTVNKLIGAYMEEGIASALVTTSEESTRIEKLLRT